MLFVTGGIPLAEKRMNNSLTKLTGYKYCYLLTDEYFVMSGHFINYRYIYL